MTILFYRYGSICEPDIIEAFRQLNIDVLEETVEMTDKQLSPAKCVELVSHAIEQAHPIFLFSINFFPAIAEVCHIYKVPYLCWTVDSPVLELFSKSICHDTNRIFMFDRAQYDYFGRFNPACCFHLPLAANTTRYDQVISSITEEDKKHFSSDISFVGSLYNEKNPMNTMGPLPDYVNGYINGVIDASLKIYGYNFMEEVLTEDIVTQLKKADSRFYAPPNAVAPSDYYMAAHEYLGFHASERERIQTLNELANYFTVDLYTRSDTSRLQNVRIHGGVKTHTEMPKVFHLSKINLNMTIKPIQTGLPLRIFDILGCGGFLMTNYQEELPEMFEIGVDLEAYSSMEELVDKCAYYLEHEEERKQIAVNGYRKVKENYSYQKRILEMIRRATT
uniref:CgeB family protein n=1 Tax=Acetatifactor sp. TaxID=1872090 RepID=UPI0040571DAD